MLFWLLRGRWKITPHHPYFAFFWLWQNRIINYFLSRSRYGSYLNMRQRAYRYIGIWKSGLNRLCFDLSRGQLWLATRILLRFWYIWVLGHERNPMIIFHDFTQHSFMLIFHHVHIELKNPRKSILASPLSHIWRNRPFLDLFGLSPCRTAMIDHCVNDFAGTSEHMPSEFHAATARVCSFVGFRRRVLFGLVATHGSRMNYLAIMRYLYSYINKYTHHQQKTKYFFILDPGKLFDICLILISDNNYLHQKWTICIPS